MNSERSVRVYLTPAALPPGGLTGGLAVVVDVLRATTTMIYALANGALAVLPFAEIEEARAAAKTVQGKVLLAGERCGKLIPGFDLGNSPAEYTASVVRGAYIISTTTNGTRAICSASGAERVLIGAFVNYSAICEQLSADGRPVHVVCSGSDGEPSLEDSIFAGALVDQLSENGKIKLNDSARLAWDSFENHGQILLGAFEVGLGGEKLVDIGLRNDLKMAAAVDQFAVVAEVRRDPLRVELSSAGIKRKYWRQKRL